MSDPVIWPDASAIVHTRPGGYGHGYEVRDRSRRKDGRVLDPDDFRFHRPIVPGESYACTTTTGDTEPRTHVFTDGLAGFDERKMS